MGRPLRYLPRPNTTFEITTRTIQGRLLLKPAEDLNDLLLGVLGRAMSLYPSVLLHLFVVASSHIHMILTVPDSKTLSLFMCHVNSNIAREAGRLYGWREKFWGRRYRAIPILDDQALLERVRYVFSHGCKENLVRRPEDWPGVHCVRALRDGDTLTGTWFDRTKEYEARRAGEDTDPLQFATRYDVLLSPLPCWADLPAGEQRRRFQEMLTNLESDIHQGHLQVGRRSVLGKREVLAQDPHSRPAKVKKSKAPICHCASFEKWCDYRNSYRFFADVFRTAAKKLKKQKPPVLFPEHCFMPSVGYFVPTLTAP